MFIMGWLKKGKNSHIWWIDPSRAAKFFVQTFSSFVTFRIYNTMSGKPFVCETHSMHAFQDKYFMEQL